jgi:hypothetical protein
MVLNPAWDWNILLGSYPVVLQKVRSNAKMPEIKQGGNIKVFFSSIFF